MTELHVEIVFLPLITFSEEKKFELSMYVNMILI